LYALGAGEFFCAVGIMLFFRAHGNGIKKYAIFFLAASAAGVFYYYGYMHWQAIRINMPHGTQGAFFGIVAQEPKAAGNFTMLTVDLSHPYSGSLDIFTSPDNTRFHYGDDLWIKGSVSPSDAMGELPAMFLPQVRVVVSHQGFWLKEALIDFKDAIAQAIARIVPPDQAALLAGILIGTTGTMSAALKAQMDISGTSYIVGMYGYKIAIITAVLAAALKDHLSRKMLLCATLGTIALFVLASGATISAVRAAIMGSFAIIARGTGRVFNARNAIVFTAVGMVLLNATLLTDAAFQLSFLSFLGIYYLGPPINNYFHWTTGGVLQWKEHAMLSLSTNLAILPIVMNTFGAFSLTSFISNILIMIPWVAVISFGALAVILNIISPVLAFCVVQIVSLLLRYELLIIRIFATVVIPLPAIFGSAWVIALYYAVLILFIYYYAAPSQKNN
jgi:ComEC/Rec2-related protein